MKVQSYRFERSAFSPEDAPRGASPGVVLLGRSNVGKSSLINRLLGAKGLARTSSTPGRTQSINFYRVNESWHFVDLPGYGYARVPERVRGTWKALVEGFLERARERITLALLVVDARHEPTALDRVMHDWLSSKQIPFLVAATKADKLSGNGRAKAVRTIRQVLGEGGDAPPLLVSAHTGLGLRELWGHLDRAFAAARQGD